MSAPLMRGVAPVRVPFGTAETCAFVLCVMLLIASPVLAFESHAVNVRMSLSAPVAVTGGEFTLIADGADAASFTAALTPTFLEQTRLTGLDYRIVAEVVPPSGGAAVGDLPSALVVRDTSEHDATIDDSVRGWLGLEPRDIEDRWFVTLQPAAGGAATAPTFGAPSVETSPTDASVSATDSPMTVAPAPGAASAARWLVHVRVEVIAYRARAGVGE